MQKYQKDNQQGVQNITPQPKGKTLPPTTAKYTVFSIVCGIVTKINCVLHHNPNPKISKKLNHECDIHFLTLMKLTEDNRKIYHTFWKNTARFLYEFIRFQVAQPAVEQDRVLNQRLSWVMAVRAPDPSHQTRGSATRALVLQLSERK